jgi:hypothetical protein
VPEPLLIYTPQLSNRLDYICKFIFKDVLQVPFVFTTSLAKIQNSTIPFINYSTEQHTNGLQIIPHRIMYQSNIEPHKIVVNQWQGLPIFFETMGKFLSFDIFAASFYLVSRFEEYLPNTPDVYGRFAHENSLAFQENFLHLPLIDMWSKRLYDALQQHNCQLPALSKQFTKIHSFDVDMISAYRHKGFARNVGGLLKEIVGGKWTDVNKRISYFFSKALDPYDCFLEIQQKLPIEKQIKYFVLCAEKNSQFDKNISLNKPSMKQLVAQLASHASVGIHPSYQTHKDPKLLPQEIKNLQDAAKLTVTDSRQHFIKFNLPDTFQQLLKAGIKNDYSMGYGSINGFRASTCTPHLWFDVSANAVKQLMLYPFCWMDANCVFEQKNTTERSLEEWNHYFDICKSYNGVMIDVWHNFIIQHENENTEWRKLWLKTIEKM